MLLEQVIDIASFSPSNVARVSAPYELFPVPCAVTRPCVILSFLKMITPEKSKSISIYVRTDPSVAITICSGVTHRSCSSLLSADRICTSAPSGGGALPFDSTSLH